MFSEYENEKENVDLVQKTVQFDLDKQTVLKPEKPQQRTHLGKNLLIVVQLQ